MIHFTTHRECNPLHCFSASFSSICGLNCFSCIFCFVIIEFAITRNIYGFDNCVKYLCESVSIENIYALQTQLKQLMIREIFEIVW